MTQIKAGTKKLLVAYGASDVGPRSGDFLALISDTTGYFLWGLKSNQPSERGMMVYTGREVTVNDVFAKLVNSGRKIDNVSQTLNCLEAYITMLQEFKIGNILAVEQRSDSACGFKLIKVANAPPVKPLDLPG